MLKSPRFSKESATNLWLQDPDLAIAARQEKRLIAEECKKRKVFPDRIAEREPPG